jgi:hypothetical protein
VSVKEQTVISHKYDDTKETIQQNDKWYHVYLVVHKRGDPSEKMGGTNAIKVHTLRVDVQNEVLVNSIIKQFPVDEDLQHLDEEVIEDADVILKGLLV